MRHYSTRTVIGLWEEIQPKSSEKGRNKEETDRRTFECYPTALIPIPIHLSNISQKTYPKLETLMHGLSLTFSFSVLSFLLSLSPSHSFAGVSTTQAISFLRPKLEVKSLVSTPQQELGAQAEEGPISKFIPQQF